MEMLPENLAENLGTPYLILELTSKLGTVCWEFREFGIPE